jgi:hypothetical protein
VLHTLFANSVDAIVAKPGERPAVLGTITFSAGRAKRGGRDGVLITVRDDGIGIAEGVVKVPLPGKPAERSAVSIYDPFYTTKTGVGSVKTLTGQDMPAYGFGLSIAARYVQDMKGEIWHDEPKPARGATAYIFIPISGRSLGVSEGDPRIQESFDLQFPHLGSSLRRSRALEFGRRLTGAVPYALEEAPALLVVHGLEMLPPRLDDLLRAISGNRYLTVIDRGRTTRELEEAFAVKYPEWTGTSSSLKEHLGIRGFKGEAAPERAVAELVNARGAGFFGERAGFVAGESERKFLPSSRIVYPYCFLYAKDSLPELVLPLGFRLLSQEGKVGGGLEDYIVEERHVFRILGLDELIKRFMLERHFAEVLAQAA